MSAATYYSIVSEVAKVFDPVGWVAPWLFKCKVLIQKTWEPWVTWDSPLPNEAVNQWLKLCATAKENVIQIRRSVSYSQKGHLHLFTDASAAAYGSLLYFVSDLFC